MKKEKKNNEKSYAKMFLWAPYASIGYAHIHIHAY